MIVIHVGLVHMKWAQDIFLTPYGLKIFFLKNTVLKFTVNYCISLVDSLWNRASDNTD